MTTPTKWEIAQHWARSLRRDRFAPRLYDLGEPCCFACGYYSEHWDKKTAKASWERAALERAHVVPHSLGGDDGIDNLILLCKPCHQESPDWPDPREMERWIATRAPRMSKEMDGVLAWQQAAVEVPEFLPLVEELAGEGADGSRLIELLQDAARQAGLHWGVGLSQGTRVAILRAAAERATAEVELAR
ncbi:HNH endonuclease [Streptomyces sp. NBRC 109706]|uniref:HNH endonuclease n=1 Tax=Streptomyces sp. NBRC 109706 TaxID=1550035 RepID=UPI000782FC00|nr:HNH endonuclease signature motif containing protein [Streptomyces sp. NBRC 109706]